MSKVEEKKKKEKVSVIYCGTREDLKFVSERLDAAVKDRDMFSISVLITRLQEQGYRFRSVSEGVVEIIPAVVPQ